MFWCHSVWRKFKMVCNTHLYQKQQPTNCENGDDAQLIFTWEWSSEVFSREEKEKISFMVFRVTWSELLIFTWKFPWNHFHENFREIDFHGFFFLDQTLQRLKTKWSKYAAVSSTVTPHWFFREGLGFEQNTLRFSFIHTFPYQIRYYPNTQPHWYKHT